MRFELLRPISSTTHFNFDREVISNHASTKALPIISIHALKQILKERGVDVVRHQSLIHEAHSNLSSFSSRKDIDNVITFVCSHTSLREEQLNHKARTSFVSHLPPPIYERRKNGD